MEQKSVYQPHETAILAEVVEVKADYIICEHISSIHYSEKCDKCDKGHWEHDFVSEEDCRKIMGCSPGSPVTVEAYKPLNLQQTPWHGRTFKYGDFRITYTYINSQQRRANYSARGPRCDAGDHLETVWPPYRVRIGTPAGYDSKGNKTKASKDYAKGDMIRIAKNVYQKEQAPNNASDENKRAQFSIDLNVDGRVWVDDCGTKQHAGSVWV